MWFIGLAGRYGNDGEMMPLQEAVYISPTCGKLQMETGQQIDSKEAEPRQNGFPHCFICPGHKYTNIEDH